MHAPVSRRSSDICRNPRQNYSTFVLNLVTLRRIRSNVINEDLIAPHSRGDQNPEKDSDDNQVGEDGVPVHQSGPRITTFKTVFIGRWRP
jgi:hypothetical protein